MTILRFPLRLVDGAPADPVAIGRPDRNLLVRGNSKLGEDICHFDLPAVDTCPGRSHNCSGVVRTSPKSKGARHCYALRLYARWPSLRAAHEANLQAVQDLASFARRVRAEITRRRIRVIRWHVSGDIFSAGYARTLLGIMTATPDTEHFLYTRSWRVPRLVPLLEQMAELPNVAVWYSCDASTGIPECRPPSVRLAWMALHAAEGEPWGCGEQIAASDLVFLDPALRHQGLTTFGGAPVCLQERDPDVTCTTCRYCLPQPPEA